MQKIVLATVMMWSLCLGSSLPGYGDAGLSGVKSSHDSSVITGISINIQDADGLEDELAGLARDLIYLKKGQPLSDVSLMQAIDALKTSRRFEHIDVQSTQEEQGMALVFTLKPYRQIKDIRIFGEFPLFEKDVLKAMTLYIGGVFSRESLPGQASRIKDLYKSEGFIEPKVTIEARQIKHENTVVLHVYIDRGPYYSINEVGIAGNRVFSAIRLKSKMNVWISSLLPGSSGRFREKDLKDDVQNLLTYYRSRGFPECRIEYTSERDPAEETVDIVFIIVEGPEYTFSFSGNEEFRDHTLRKDLVLYQQGNISGGGLRRSIKNITQRYINAGYAEASIDIQEETSQTDKKTRRKLHLVIREGPRTKVASLEFEGGDAFGSGKLSEQVYLAKGKIYTRQTLEDDLLALKTFYLQNGFGDAVVDHRESWSRDRHSVSIVLKISEGAQTVISSIRITGMNCVSEEEAYGALNLKKGTPLRRYMLKSDENALAARISEKGYPHVTVQAQTSLSEDRSKAEVDYIVDEGPPVTMGNIYYRGNFRTREKILYQEIEMDRDAPFSLREMLAGQRNIRDLAIFNSVQFKTIGLKEKRQEITLLADMEEKEPYYFQVGGGYESERGLFAHTSGGDHNLFGTNKDSWVAGEVSQIGYKAETGIREPRLLGTRTSATLGLFSEKRQEFNQDFGTSTLGASLGFNRRLARYITAGLNFRFERRDQFLSSSGWETADPVNEDEFDPRSILVTMPSIMFDTRDSFIRPTRGVFSSLSVDISQGIQNSLDNFFKYRFDARFFVTPVERITLAWLGRLGYLVPFGASDEIPDDQLFYLGGTLDVRGFDENLLRVDSAGDPQGGRFSLAGSVEARIDLWRNLELTGFYDIGTVRKTYEDLGPDDFRSSVGLGLRYITPIGPIGVLYGHKLDRKHGESPGRFHFSIGYTF